jgi:hypothetical protein
MKWSWLGDILFLKSGQDGYLLFSNVYKMVIVIIRVIEQIDEMWVA